MSLSPHRYVPIPPPRRRSGTSNAYEIDSVRGALSDHQRLRTTLVIDDELVRHGLTHVMSCIEEIHFVGDLRHGPELAERIRLLQPELLVLGMPPTGTLTDLLTELDSTVKVVVVTDSEHADINTVELLRAGADALVDRRSPAADLRATFAKVVGGQPALDALSVQSLITELRSPPVSRTAGDTRLLTARERDVLNELVEGLDNRTIAGRLFVSEATVKFHLHNIMNKFGVHKRAALIAAALRGADATG
ncbi:DNA-binding NarL/FixJ family response regulator [Arthrobacter sp. SLBN-53]|nr:DNA-binding NarL/FixJ family response regulator [Arthrobacter sp. SLBN-53]